MTDGGNWGTPTGLAFDATVSSPIGMLDKRSRRANATVLNMQHMFRHRETSQQIHGMCEGSFVLQPTLVALPIYRLMSSCLHYKTGGASRLPPFLN
jgi:hypothetical protein